MPIPPEANAGVKGLAAKGKKLIAFVKAGVVKKCLEKDLANSIHTG